ncbi:MAG: ABC transporter permease [Anaerolineales bacterium]
MTYLDKKVEEKQDAESSWRAELQEVGFVRRLLLARKWYGADWWLVAISSLMVFGFFLLAVIPGVFSPYGPHELVGPRFLAPGEVPAVPLLVVQRESEVEKLGDLARPIEEGRAPVAVVQGLPSSGALNEKAQQIDKELRESGGNLRLRPRTERYDSREAMLQAVADGEVEAAVVQSGDFEDLSEDFPGLRAASSITGGRATQGEFIMGTNEIGQDVFSRLIWGTRVAFLIGFSASTVALFFGVPLGLTAGYLGGRFDRLLSLLMDSLYAFPGLILAIAITAVLGPSVFNVIVAIAVLYIPTYYRIVRGQTLAVKEEIYVEAARSIGARRMEILRRYIYPNVIPSVAIIFSVNVADAILTGAGLSFLGLGLPPTIADWGIDLARGQRFIQTAWWMITFPGLAIMLVVLAFTMMGEGLMEIFNPKLRER